MGAGPTEVNGEVGKGVADSGSPVGIAEDSWDAIPETPSKQSWLLVTTDPPIQVRVPINSVTLEGSERAEEGTLRLAALEASDSAEVAVGSRDWIEEKKLLIPLASWDWIDEGRPPIALDRWDNAEDGRLRLAEPDTCRAEDGNLSVPVPAAPKIWDCAIEGSVRLDMPVITDCVEDGKLRLKTGIEDAVEVIGVGFISDIIDPIDSEVSVSEEIPEFDVGFNPLIILAINPVVTAAEEVSKLEVGFCRHIEAIDSTVDPEVAKLEVGLRADIILAMNPVVRLVIIPAKGTDSVAALFGMDVGPGIQNHPWLQSAHIQPYPHGPNWAGVCGGGQNHPSGHSEQVYPMFGHGLVVVIISQPHSSVEVIGGWVLEGEGVTETPLEHVDAGKAEVIFDTNVKEDENDGHTLN
jgi:hypothetical protein